MDEKKADLRGYLCTAALCMRSSSVPLLRPLRKIYIRHSWSRLHKSLSPSSTVPIPHSSNSIPQPYLLTLRPRSHNGSEGDMIAAMDLY